MRVRGQEARTPQPQHYFEASIGMFESKTLISIITQLYLFPRFFVPFESFQQTS